MPKALVCINTSNGSDHVVENLKKVKGVNEVHTSKGLYDVVALVQADSIDDLKSVISGGVRKVDNVKATLTLQIV